MRDFEDILAADNPDVWQSHRPAEGGDAGAMLKKIIERAAALKAGREASAPSASPAPRSRKTATKKSASAKSRKTSASKSKAKSPKSRTTKSAESSRR